VNLLHIVQLVGVGGIITGEGMEHPQSTGLELKAEPTDCFHINDGSEEIHPKILVPLQLPQLARISASPTPTPMQTTHPHENLSPHARSEFPLYGHRTGCTFSFMEFTTARSYIPV
jgi:hypothetical protein